MRAIPGSAAMLLWGAAALAQSIIPNSPGVKGTFAIRDATIHPVTRPVIERGRIVIAGGTIAAVGPDVAIPPDAEVIDGTGLHVYPGMIDANTNVGLTEIGSVRGSVDVAEIGQFNPNARAAVAINPHSELVPVTRVNGVTTVVVVPEGGVISGQDALINLAGWTPDEMIVRAPVAMHVSFPRLRSGGFGGTPNEEEEEKEAKKGYEKRIEDLKKVVRDAQAYAKGVRAREQNRGLPPIERDLMLESMIDLVEGRILVVIHADQARDIRAAVAFADEMGLRMILAGGAHVQEVVDLLREKEIPVLLGPVLALPPREDDPYDLIFSNAAALHRAGVPFAFQTRDAHNARNLPYHAAAAAAFGLPKQAALEAVTIAPARILGVADRLGSLEVGKMANVIVTDGDPLEIRTSVRHLFIAGEPIPLDSRHTLLYQKFRARPTP
ncbi:MAG TPA: amidohydrolase family protein [Thermoanaerobaculia bacterium]|nr:amidohydrolase family protein [Thermoanaerobaculia bacterium]